MEQTHQPDGRSASRSVWPYRTLHDSMTAPSSPTAGVPQPSVEPEEVKSSITISNAHGGLSTYS